MPDFKQVKEIFLAVAERTDAKERESNLCQACGDDAELRRQVEELLRWHEQPGNFLEQPPLDSSPTLPPARDVGLRQDTAGTCLGAYKLLQMIGEGGMGAVWMAEQQEPVRRLVAVKLIRAGQDGGQAVARFEAERQALALMHHPNIATVLDGGATADGRPYLVMELVQGTPITPYCDQHRLTLRQRLELFVQVCRALQHAHQKGIIHRDVKPSNVLVAPFDGQPMVKVIDFGVAKAVGQRLTEKTFTTQFGAVVGTLEYMSPEQAELNNQDIDTRSDIYALGVLLYELLTGSTPLTAERRQQSSLLEVLRAIREEEPPRPSTRLSNSAETLPAISAQRQTDPAKLRKLLRGELDWIVMKALAKERDRRYESANSFAGDVERFLNHEPVLAGPPSTAYRLRKFVRRNRTQVIAGCLLLLALLIGLAGTTFGLIRAEIRRGEAEQARADEAKQRGIAQDNEVKALTAAEEEKKAKGRESAQRIRAEQARDRTREALDDMTSAVTGDSLITQKEISDEQKKFLTQMLTYYQEFAGEKADDEPSRVRTAAAAFRVGMIESRLGRKSEAMAATRLAYDGFAKLAAEVPAEPHYRQQLANSHNNLGVLLRDLEKQPQAEEQHRKALALQEKLAAEFPTVPKYRFELVKGLNNLGNLLREVEKRSEAAEQIRNALAIQGNLAADFPAMPEYRFELAASHANLGTLLREAGNRPEAEEQFRKALALQEKLAADFPAVPAYRFELAASHANLGTLLREVGNRPEAEEQFRKALALQEKLAADFPAAPVYRLHLAGSHSNLGIVLWGLGKRPEAEEQFRKALVIREKLAAEFLAVPVYRLHLAGSHNNLGSLLMEVGERPEAEEQFRKALALQEKLAADFTAVPAYRFELANSHNNLGNLLGSLGKRPEAEEHYREALAIREKLAAEFPEVPRYQVELGGSYCNFGNLVRDSGQLSESLGWYEKAIRTLTATYEQDDRLEVAKQFLRNSHVGRARAYDRLNKNAEAVKDWDRAIELSPKADQPLWRASRATSRLQAGQVAEAVAEVAELTKSSTWNALRWYDFACVYAVASGKSGDKKQEYADRAMVLLQQAVNVGFQDAAQVAKDTDLDPLRERDDFKKLLAELAKKSAAKPKNQP